MARQNSPGHSFTAQGTRVGLQLTCPNPWGLLDRLLFRVDWNVQRGSRTARSESGPFKGVGGPHDTRHRPAGERFIGHLVGPKSTLAPRLRSRVPRPYIGQSQGIGVGNALLCQCLPSPPIPAHVVNLLPSFLHDLDPGGGADRPLPSAYGHTWRVCPSGAV
jgi:hypothetical protein